ncbi:MAG: hypothetical protein WAM82_14235 [Thermoanaerobaculia bacterium]
MRARATVLGVALSGILAMAALPARGTQVKIFQAQSSSAFLAGTLEGVSVDALGRIQLAPRVEKVASLAEPFLLSAAVHPDGWVVGTGNAGKVLKIDRKGAVTELFAAPEPEVFAVLVDPDGTVYAGTSPRGKVYRFRPGHSGNSGNPAKAEPFFDPQETYIWALARGADGSLLVGTGTQGKLFKVDAKGKGQVFYDSDDTHIRSLAVLPGGDVVAGTAGSGLILRIGRDGKARTLYDSSQPEVVSLAATPDGTCYAAVVASEASLVDQARDQTAPPAPAAGPPGGKSSSGPQVTVTVEPEAPPPPGPRRPGGPAAASAPRSEVLSISPAGVVESLWIFTEETIYDLLWQNGRLWVGTGLEGKLFRWADRQMLLEKDVDERQIVAVLPGEPGPAIATTNAAALYRIVKGTERTGTYTSAALDAEQMARFGTLAWKGELPAGTAVRFSFRSGVSAEPDRTWSAWTEPREGREIPLAGVPNGRFVQWRAELKGSERSSPRLYEVELSYRQENLRPKITLFAALEPGQVLVPANFNPSNQVFEPSHPAKSGIFTTLTPGNEEEGGGRVKALWKLGYQTLRWVAVDPNGDDLVYDLSFRLGEGEDAADTEWHKMVEGFEEDHYSFDALSLPDGTYRFRLRASDRKANDPASALEAERVSEPVVIDHTLPALVKVEKAKDGTLKATVSDAASPLREAVYSVNTAEWQPAQAADGLLDGRTETLLIPPVKPGDLVMLRVTDAANNVITFQLNQER